MYDPPLNTCPATGRKCQTAYQSYSCRCETCKAYMRWYRKQRPPTREQMDQKNYRRFVNRGGICTQEEFNAASNQPFCSCCGVELPSREVRHVDHCHTTGKLRGTLCQACNKAEGYLKTIKRAEQMLAYMRYHNGPTA